MKSNVEITGIILYNGRKWITKRGRKRKLVKKVRLMEHLEQLGLKTSNRLNKEGKPIKINCIITGIRAWLFPKSNNNNSKATKKVRVNTKTQTRSQKVADKTEREYDLYCLSNRHMMVRNLQHTT